MITYSTTSDVYDVTVQHKSYNFFYTVMFHFNTGASLENNKMLRQRLIYNWERLLDLQINIKSKSYDAPIWRQNVSFLQVY